MLSLLLNPDFITGIAFGFIAGALVATGLLALGAMHRERAERLDTERHNRQLRAQMAARAWSPAANDDIHHSARSDQRRVAR